MKKEIFNFLKSYSCGTLETNRLIVSSFMMANKLDVPRNKLICSLFINKDDSDFEQLIEFNNRHQISTIEDLITAFEFVISPEEKVVTGAIYTPIKIREFIVTNVLSQFLPDKPSVCDIACGCGGFLYTSTKTLKENLDITYKEIFETLIFGVDLMDYSILRTQILLSLQAIIGGEDEEEFRFNLYVGNSLDFDFNDVVSNFSGFSAIVGNPPYVCSRNLDTVSKSLLKKWEVSSTGHPDLYIPFFEIALSFLKESGFLGYITMNSFFKSLNGRALRAYFSRNMFKMRILDFGGVQVFDSRSTYTCICLIQNNPTGHISYKKVTSIDKLSFKNLSKLTYQKLDDHNGWNFQSYKIINKIESIGTPFYKVFNTSSGIATLKNNVFIIDYINEDEKYYYLSGDEKVEKSVCVDIINPNKFIRTNDIDKIKKKIIFPYIYVDNRASIISESEFKKKYRFTYKYLKTHEKDLLSRDKGKGIYPEWYAFGRTQGLDKRKYKLFFPHITPVIPNFVLTDDDSLLFRNGMSLISDDKNSMLLAQKIMKSNLFWFYIENTSKPYGSNYYSLSRNYIKSFGIYDFSEEQKEYIINENDQEKVNEFLEELYGVHIPI
ncbi:SAM-dependent DNA methyltransferase [Aliivibrio finisterrensis]|uniref:Eco57I restriction-modification methylase domain-containing protein n=1 Tax=Aliivibrio finisterrensis TaxID=511998 RepID=UPI001021F26A|nr:N-6 DNA methylase [Aliivibrio finisterrensis]RYU68091.1 SAM-dependent DNA methyltransferase [Aliivibrio finisterrensis]RYU71759.1 SAM-dependent DNA methyltransferase [Aliivibrio finisterrensis]RYU75434.1 SAM-dependent DNA methyltransferase [Aliivibrio finisterrensis]